MITYSGIGPLGYYSLITLYKQNLEVCFLASRTRSPIHRHFLHISYFLFDRLCFQYPRGRGDLTICEALHNGIFDHDNWQHSGEFDQFFFLKTQISGGGMGTLVFDRNIR